MLGPVWWIMPAAVLFSTFGAANGLCFSSGRFVHITLLMYAMGGTRGGGGGQGLRTIMKYHSYTVS